MTVLSVTMESSACWTDPIRFAEALSTFFFSFLNMKSKKKGSDRLMSDWRSSKDNESFHLLFFIFIYGRCMMEHLRLSTIR